MNSLGKRMLIANAKKGKKKVKVLRSARKWELRQEVSVLKKQIKETKWYKFRLLYLMNKDLRITKKLIK